MSYRIAGIDVHKKVIAVVVADVAGEGAYEFERRKFGTRSEALRELAAWLVQQEVEEVVMESTAQYWRPVWDALEQHWQASRRQREGAGKMAGELHLAQAQSNRGPRGRKNDYADAERLVKRLVAQELRLSFVPPPEQRLWRSVTRQRNQLTEQRVRLQNQLEALLEQGHLKLSSVVSDLLGVSGRRMLEAIAAGVDNPSALAALAAAKLRATPQQLCDALSACTDLRPTYRKLLKMNLEQLDMVEKQMQELDREISSLLQPYQAAVQRLAEVPGLGVASAHQIIAELGPRAASFPSAKDLSSWVGVCPGAEETAEVNRSSRSPKGNRNLRRLLTQAAHAAVKTKGSIFAVRFQRLRHGLEYAEAIWAVAHRLCRLIWKILYQEVRYEERGPAVAAKSKRARTGKMIRELRKLGYRVEFLDATEAAQPA